MSSLSWIAASASEEIAAFFKALTLILVMAVGASLLLQKARQSVLIGYLLCGFLLGPSGFGLVTDDRLIAQLADVGVVLLMFTLGVEFSFNSLRSLQRTALVSGNIQVIGVGFVAFCCAWAYGFSPTDALVIAFLVALSSTALALKIFHDEGQGVSSASRLALGIAIHQDILVVLFLLILPPLYDTSSDASLAMRFIPAVVKGLGFLIFGWVMSRFLVTPLLRLVARTRSRELFSLVVLALCTGVATVGNLLGLSLAIGAFVAGLVVSESIYSHRILAEVLPFKDFFLMLFFVSIGMLVDLQFFVQNPLLFVGIFLLLLVAKALIAIVAGWLGSYPLRDCLKAGFALASLGELSLVILEEGSRYGAFTNEIRQFFLLGIPFTMGLAPILVRWAPNISRWLEKSPRIKKMALPGKGMVFTEIEKMKDHAVIVGYGPVGRQLHMMLQKVGIPTLIIDLNADTIQELKKKGQWCLYADISHEETLRLARVEHAKIMAITFPSFDTAQSVWQHLQERQIEIPFLCRVKFTREAQELSEKGVWGVIHDEGESSRAMLHRTIEEFGIRPDEIEVAFLEPKGEDYS